MEYFCQVMSQDTGSDSSLQIIEQVPEEPMIIDLDPEEDPEEMPMEYEPMEHDAVESDEDEPEEDPPEDVDSSDTESVSSPAAAASEPPVHPVPTVRDFPVGCQDPTDPIGDEAVPGSPDSVTSPFDPTVLVFYGRPPTP